MVTVAPEAIQAREDSRRACLRIRCRRGRMSEGYAQRRDPARVYGVRRLDQSEFIGAHLRGANLPGASLREADLTDAPLRRNLRDADLRNANLTRADLGGADLCGARLLGAQVADVRADYGTRSRARHGPPDSRLRSKPDTDYGAWSSSCDTPRAYPPN